METDTPVVTHPKFRIDCQLEDVKSVWLKLHSLGQHELYDKIRQLEEWAETLDSREEKQHKRLEELSVLAEDPVASYTKAGVNKHAERLQMQAVAEARAALALSEEHTNEELQQFEPPTKKHAPASSASKKAKIAPENEWIIRIRPNAQESTPHSTTTKDPDTSNPNI